jgi:chromosome segregation ATPase
MSEETFQFRTAVFGGFQKEDVLAYLERSAQAHAEKVSALQRDLDEAQEARTGFEQRAEAQESRMMTLETENQRLAADLTQRELDLTSASVRQRELEDQIASLQAEVEKLRPSAQAYETVKDRTASIELEAHGRAQAIEEEGRRKAKEAQEGLVAWLDKMEGEYGKLQDDAKASLLQTIGVLDRAKHDLVALSGGLSGHEESLKAIRQELEDLDSPAVLQGAEGEETV